MQLIPTSPAEAACLDLSPPGTLWIRLGGTATAIPQRIERLRKLCRGTINVSAAQEDEQLWDSARELSWRADHHRVVRVPIAPRNIPHLERELQEGNAGPRR